MRQQNVFDLFGKDSQSTEISEWAGPVFVAGSFDDSPLNLQFGFLCLERGNVEIGLLLRQLTAASA